MQRLKVNIFITGVPGVGKTTFIERLIKTLPEGVRWKGFFTREVREKGKRVGFQIITHNNQKGWLAHVKFQEGPKVGKYRVCLKDLLSIGVPAIDPSGADIIIIDEIGTMEMLSGEFKNALLTALDSSTPVLATIKKKGNRELENIKHRPDSTLFELTPENREEIYEMCVSEILRIIKTTK